MSSAQEYYDTLMAQGYTPEQAKGFTQQHFPGFSPAAAMPASMPAAPQPMAMATAPQMGMPMGAPMGGMMPAPGVRPGVLSWVALGLTAAAITMVFIAMFSNSWMTGEEEDFEVYFGLSELEAGNNDGDTDTEKYSQCDDDNDECQDVASAGTTGQIFLWIAVSVAIASLVLMCLNNFNVYNSKFGMIACFVSGGLAIGGAVIWLVMFPELDWDLDLGPGISFYLAIIAGVCSLGSGVCEIISNRN